MTRLFLFLRWRMGSGPEDLYITRNPGKMRRVALDSVKLRREPEEAWDRDLMAEVIVLEHTREGWQPYQSLGVDEDTADGEVEEFLGLAAVKDEGAGDTRIVEPRKPKK